MKTIKTMRRVALAALPAVILISSLAGCSAGSPSTEEDSVSDVKVVVVSGPLSDPFFGAMKAGAEQAGKDLGVTVQYTAPTDLKNIGPDLARLTDAASAASPSAVVISEFIPDSQDPGIEKLVAADIPVVFMNAGPNWESLGGTTYIGEDPTVFGRQAGEKLAAAGAKRVLCVNHIPGNPTMDARCDGLESALSSTGGTASVLNIPADQSTNPTAITTAISGALRSDSSIDAVLTLGSGVAENAVKAVESADSSAIVGTGDLSKNVLDLIKSGELEFAIDQQPYLQGYYSVLAATQTVTLGLHPVGQVVTAPLFITKENVDETIVINDKNNGLRGAA